MTKHDFVIVCGDFGGVWNGDNEEKYWQKWLHNRNFTTLFADGNHENHHMLNEYPVEVFCGGKVHKINHSIYHLMRGEIYTLDEKKLFVMGGASSHDKEFRTENVSWWAEELPSDDEYENAIYNLTTHGWNVDYIVSHCCADSTQAKISRYFSHDKLTNFFEHIIKADCTYSKWYFGHYHYDVDIDEKHICLYNRVIKLDCIK